MPDYLFIQSQDPFTEIATTSQYQLATQLSQAGNSVTVLLVQNGVVPARRNARSEAFDQLLQSGVTVIADDFSLHQREIADSDLKDNIAVTSIHKVIDAMLAGHKVIWN